MTPKQAAMIDLLKARILERNAAWGATEMKHFAIEDVREDSDLVFMVIEVGSPNDEGTLASVFCRDRRHIMIGPNGGCTLLNPKVKGKTRNRGVFHCVHNLTA